MVMILTDGFDLQTAAATTSGTVRWTAYGNFGTTGFFSIPASSGRVSGNAMSVGQGNNSGFGPQQFFVDSAGAIVSKGQTLIAGFAFQSSSFSIGMSFFNFTDGNTFQMGLRTDSTGHLVVTRGGSNSVAPTVLATETNPMLINQWYYIEFKVTLGSGTSGSYAVRRNQGTIAGLSDTSGINTLGTGNTTANSVVLGAHFDSVNPGVFKIDDLYVCDNTGANNTNFLGDVRVIGMLPNNVGTNSQFTRVGGSSSGNYTAVNEATPDNDTSYVTAQAVNSEDTYNYSTLPINASTVYAVSGVPVMRKDNTGIRTVGTRVRQAASEATSGAANLTVTYTPYCQPMDTNPATGVSWNVNDIGTAEIGPVITA